MIEEGRMIIEICYLKDGIRYDAVSSDENIRIDIKQEEKRSIVDVTALTDIVLEKASLPLTRKFDDSDLIMANGYQSWTETYEFMQGEHLNSLEWVPDLLESRYHFRSYGSQAFKVTDKEDLLGFDFSYVKGEQPLVIGSLNYRNAYLMIHFVRRAHMIILESDVSGKALKPGQTFRIFDYILAEDKDEYLDRFHPVTDMKLFGYTSWYNHYQDINSEKIGKALSEVDKRFDLFQIDDGFEEHVGDWLRIDREKFPEGLTPFVDEIHKKGMKAGIWLAPLIAENDSDIVKDHPDYIAADENGNRIYAGGNWSGFSPLDLNNRDAVDYIRRSIKYYVDMGFDFFKFDFLYAVNLKPLDGCTRAETSEYAYRLLREELSGKIILGCGACLMNAAEKFDFMRIGPDVSLAFDDVPYMKLFHPESISTKVTIKNTIYRSIFNGKLFMNDPDVFLLRDDIKMTSDQRISLAGMNALFGSLMMTSDNIGEYSVKKKIALEHALDLFYNGTVNNYRREGKYINIDFELSGKPGSFRYDTVKGIITDRRWD